MREAPPKRLAGHAWGVFGLAAALAVALGLGLQLDQWRSIALLAVGAVALAGAFGAAQMPLLGLIGVVVVTVGNVADVLIRYWGAPSITMFLVPGLTFILMWRWIFNGERPLFPPGVIVAITVFLLMILLSVFYAHDYRTALAQFDETTRNMIIVLLFIMFFSYRHSVTVMAYSVLWLGVVCSALAVYKYGVAGDLANEYRGLVRISVSGRLTGPWADPNYYGAILVMMLPFAVDRALWSRTTAGRLLGLIAIGLIVASLVLTRSRGAMLASICGAALYGLTLDRKSATLYFGAAVAAGFVVAGMLSDAIVARFSTVFEVAQTGLPPDLSVAERLSAWTVAVQLFYEHPVFGVGAGNYNTLYQTTANALNTTFSGRPLSPHGLYLEVLSEHGVIGLAIFLGIIGAAFAGLLRAMAILGAQGEMRARALCAAFAVALASHLVAMVFLHGPGARLLWLFLAVGIAMPAIVRHRLAARAQDGASPAGGALAL